MQDRLEEGEAEGFSPQPAYSASTAPHSGSGAEHGSFVQDPGQSTVEWRSDRGPPYHQRRQTYARTSSTQWSYAAEAPQHLPASFIRTARFSTSAVPSDIAFAAARFFTRFYAGTAAASGIRAIPSIG